MSDITGVTNLTQDSNGSDSLAGIKSAIGNLENNKVELSDLGDAATKNVGTTAGTVAAGNHNHTGIYDPAGTTSTHAALTATHGVSGNIVGTSDTQTLTNKRVTPRVGTEASSTTSTPTGDSSDAWTITALAAADAIAAPTGTPTDMQKLIIRIKDNGTARALSWNAIYRASSDLPLPTTTVLGKTMYLGFLYNFPDSKWDFVAYLNNI